MSTTLSVPAPALTQLTTRKYTILLCDLAGYARTCARLDDDVKVAQFLDRYYNMCCAAIREAGGRPIKFMGDGVLAVLEADAAPAAVECATALQGHVEQFAKGQGMTFGLECNIHIANVVEGEFGPEGFRQTDIVGAGVNHTFMMGSGPGIRISEPVYRQLPNNKRAAWNKRKPPATYVYTGK